MIGKWARWTLVALAASLVAVTAHAKPMQDKHPTMRVEVQAQKPGQEPAVRVWANGKEVQPGQPLPAGAQAQISLHTIVDPAAPGDKQVRTAASSSRRSVRVEVRADRPGQEPKVRMWVDGKEVEPGEVAARSGKGPVHFYAFSHPGPKGDDRPDKDRGVLGVMIAPLDDETAERARVKAGAVVQGTTPDSAAEKAGLREGDVITRVDDRKIQSPQELAEYIGDRRPGDRVRLEWSRNGRRMDETVILGRHEGSGIETIERGKKERKEEERPAKEKQPAKEDRPEKKEPAEGFLGVMVQPVTDELREFAGTDKGALINNLPDDSPAAKAGLQPGDVITRVDDREVGEPGDLVDAVREHKPGDRVHIVYYRKGERREAKVTLGKRPGEGPPGRKEGMPLFDLPRDLFGNLPQLRKYLEQLQPNLEEWAKRWREQQRKTPLKPTPVPKLVKPKPEHEPYDVGKDMGRILERLDRIERRLDQVEKRLERRER